MRLSFCKNMWNESYRATSSPLLDTGFQQGYRPQEGAAVTARKSMPAQVPDIPSARCATLYAV
ncbi:MAG: hypothetical protein RR014_06150, partial [Bilophila sp.]